MEFGLRDKCVLVTGASGTIGRATAVAFGAEGARVAVGYHRRRDEAELTARETEAAGGKAVAVEIDLAQADRADAGVATVQSELGGLDVLVNNAVAWPARPEPGQSFESQPIEHVAASIEANLLGQYALSQAAVARMRPSGWGRIVHLSTGLVDDGFSGSAAYTTPKAGLHGLARTMSRELAADGILTNVVKAGFIARDGMPEAILAQASRSAATGRATEPWEVANLIVFLCSAANGHISGETIAADGHFLSST